MSENNWHKQLRDLDAEIAETVFGWKLTPIGKDANGENACEVLTKNGVLDKQIQPPNVGKLHKGFYTPQYSGNRDEAIKLAVSVGLKMDISEIDFSDWKFPEKLARKALGYFKSKKQT